MKTKLLLAIVLAHIAAHHCGQAQIIANGSFESPVVDNDNVFGLIPTSWMWNVQPPPAIGRIWHVSPPYVPQDGDQYFALASPQVPRCCRLSQSFALTNPGPYKLRWYDKTFGAPRYSVAVSNGTVEVAGQTNVPNLQWTERVLRFSASAGTYTLEFRNEAASTAGDLDSQLDNVSLEPDLPPQLIANGSFESPVVGNDAFGITPTSWMWNHESEPFVGTVGHVNELYVPQDGDQYVVLFGIPFPQYGRLSQVFALTNPGPYKLRWYDKNFGFGRYSVVVLNGAVEVAGQTNIPNHQWTERVLRFSASTGTYTLEFRNEVLTTGDFESQLDNVSLEPDLPPQLSIERMAGNIRVSWPLPAEDFLLEEVDAITSSPVTGWTPVPFPYQTNATHISITVPAAAGNKFYRLRKP